MRQSIAWCRWARVLVLAVACGCSGGTESEGDPPLDGFDPVPTTVKAFISNGHTQCNDNAMPLSQSQMMLVNLGIDVLDSTCGVITGVAFAAVCGGGTGEINLHTIRRVNLPDAERLGFRDVGIIGVDPQVPGTGYQEASCLP